MAIDTGLFFKIKADGSQAKREANETARAIKQAFDKDPFGDMRVHLDSMKARLAVLRGAANDAAQGIARLDDTAKRSGGRGGGMGQFIEALAQGDPGELLGEIAQQGGKAGVAVAGVTLAAAGAAVAIGAMTARMIELVRETDKLARDTKLSSQQIQALQVVANLTGESVEDLAENYKKLSPEVQRFNELVKASGALIDDDLRGKTREAASEFEVLKLTAQGALNAIARESLPAVSDLLREVNNLIREGQGLWQGIGNVAGGVLYSISTLIRNLRTDLSGLLLDLGKAALTGNAANGAAAVANAFARGAIAEATDPAPKAPPFPNVPRIGGGSRSGGRKDISEAELQIRLLRAEQDEAQRGLNGTREAAQRLYDITIKLHEAERAQAASDLPRARQAKLAEIQQKEKEALEKYSELLKKISDDELKPIEELSRRINEDNARTVQLMQEQIERELELKALRLERRAIEADLLEQSATALARSGGSSLRVQERRARAAAIREDIAFERAALSIEREREEAERQQDFARVKELNALMEAEQRRHVAALAEIGRELDAFNDRLNPLSRRSLFGDAFADLRASGVSHLQALAQQASQSFAQMSADAGNFGTIASSAVGQFTQGLGEMIGAFILSGETGPAALRKLTAAVLANIAQQAAVKAVFELAAGFAALFWNPAEAAAHFTSAALYGSVAAAAGFAARAVAPSTEEGSASTSATRAAGNQIRSITQDTAQGIGPTLSGGRATSFGSSGDGNAVSGLASETSLGVLREIAQDLKRILENTDLLVETTKFARDPINRFGNLLSGILGFGFAAGGYTGDGLSSAMAGVVHKGEYVFSSNAVRNLGLARLEQLHTQAKAGTSVTAPASPRPLHITATLAPGIILDVFERDFRGNGVTRQMIRNDVGANAS